MITLTLDWREVLWWMQGGMAGSHNCWGVYEDMVNKVWPQCSEQERRNLWYIMRRDLGFYWRPDGWRGRDTDFDAIGDGPWKPTMDDVRSKRDDVSQQSAITHQPSYITDTTPWMYFRQVLARFDPENQYAVTMPVTSKTRWENTLLHTPAASIITRPNLSHIKCDEDWKSDTTTVTVRTYKWQYPEGHDAYFINWRRRCDPDRIAKVEKLEIPDDGTM